MIKKYLVLRPIVFLGVTLDSGTYIDMSEEEAKNIGLGKYLEDTTMTDEEKTEPIKEPEETKDSEAEKLPGEGQNPENENKQ
jgi:hypothetical protein